MSKTAVLITDSQTGEENKYIPLSERYQEFLNQYGPDDGYRIEIDTSDYLQQNPGLNHLYETAIAAGKNPEDIGLPKIMEVTIFRARLFKDDQVIQTASSAKPMMSYKDWEIGETAARQRLIAAMGFGSEAFLDDELKDLKDQDIQLELGVTGQSQPATVTEIPKSEQPKVTPKPKSKPSEKGISAQLMKKIVEQAAILKKEVPKFEDEADAKAFYKELLKTKTPV